MKEIGERTETKNRGRKIEKDTEIYRKLKRKRKTELKETKIEMENEKLY